MRSRFALSVHEHTAMYKVADLKFGICLLCGGMNLKGGSDGHVQAQIFPVGCLQTGSAGRQARGWRTGGSGG